MKNLIEFLLIHVVNNPEDIVIQEEQQSNDYIYTIKVHPDDIAMVIGSGGSYINALRRICRIYASREHINVRINLES